MSNGIGSARKMSCSIAHDEFEIREFARKNRMSEQRARDVIAHFNFAASTAAAVELRERARRRSMFTL